MKQILVLLQSCILFFLLSTPGAAAQSLPVKEIKTFVDSTGNLTIDQIRHPEILSKFSTSRSLAQKFPTWVAIGIAKETTAGQYCIDFVLPVEIEIFYVKGDSVVRKQTGPFIRPSLRPFANQPLAFCFDIDNNHETIYVRVPPATFKGREVPNLKYTTYDHMESIVSRITLGYAIMAGSIMIILIIALTMWGFLRDSVFLFFGIYIVFFYASINKIFITGLLGDVMPGIFLNLSINQLFFIFSPVAFLCFSWVYMKLKESSGKWRNAFIAFMSFGLLCTVLAFTHPPESTIPILFFNFGTMVLVTIVAYKKYYREKWRPAGYFLAAMLVPLVISAIVVFNNLEIISVKHLQIFGDFSMLTFCLILGVGVVQRYRNSSELEDLNNTKDKLLSVLAHDLRGPVGNLNAIMSLLSERAMSPDEFHMISGKLKTDVSSAYDMLEGVLQWVNSQRNGIVVKPSDFDIGELVKEVVAIGTAQANAKKIRIVTEKTDDVMAHADRDHINIVLRNFLGNAIKFSPENSEIRISFEKKDDNVSVTIKDQGVGLGVEDVKKILRKEKIGNARGTRGEKGTGLGLLLCQEFITYNNGKFHLSSERGRGTTAGFAIPAVK